MGRAGTVFSTNGTELPNRAPRYSVLLITSPPGRRFQSCCAWAISMAMLPAKARSSSPALIVVHGLNDRTFTTPRTSPTAAPPCYAIVRNTSRRSKVWAQPSPHAPNMIRPPACPRHPAPPPKRLFPPNAFQWFHPPNESAGHSPSPTSCTPSPLHPGSKGITSTPSIT